MYKEKFAERLRELIGAESVSSVAKKVGIPQQTLSRYLLCQREIGIENLCRIATEVGPPGERECADVTGIIRSFMKKTKIRPIKPGPTDTGRRTCLR